MKHFLFLTLLLALCACKTQSTIAHRAHYPQSTIHDSVSITYKQGTVQPLSISNIEEQPSPSGLRGAQTAFRRNSSAPADGTVGLGATREASVSKEALSERTNKEAVPPTPTIRVDTVFVERWHTEVKVESESESGKSKPAKPVKPVKPAKLVFYKDCTWGFFILLLLILGRIALRILKAVCLRR